VLFLIISDKLVESQCIASALTFSVISEVHWLASNIKLLEEMSVRMTNFSNLARRKQFRFVINFSALLKQLPKDRLRKLVKQLMEFTTDSQYRTSGVLTTQNVTDSTVSQNCFENFVKLTVSNRIFFALINLVCDHVSKFSCNACITNDFSLKRCSI
jgi:DNA-binding transcriptional regulator GbsR (MarR family)